MMGLPKLKLPRIASPKAALEEATRLTRAGRLRDAMSTLLGEMPVARVKQTGPRGDRFGSAAATNASGTLRDLLDRFPRKVPATSDGKPKPSVSQGARFEAHTYSDTAGTREYKLYIPASYTGEPAPLVVMLHGCTQSPDDFAAGTRMNEVAEDYGFLVAYPAQPASAHMSKCWNWYNVADQKRDLGEPSLIAGITRRVASQFSVDATRVYIAGMSAGGAAAAIMAAEYPDLYAAVGIHSGLACGAARNLSSALGAMRSGASKRPNGTTLEIPTIVFHGDRDTTVNPLNGDQIIAQTSAKNLATNTERSETTGALPYTLTRRVDPAGRPVTEQWLIHGVAHAWSGGSATGTYTDPRGPDASREMAKFFLRHSKTNSPRAA